MSLTHIQKLIHSTWLQDKVVLRELDDQWVEMTTLYLDRHNDCIQVYAKREEGGYLLTDDGYILNDLLSSGGSLDNMRELLKTTLLGFGAYLDGKHIVIHALDETFPLKTHQMIQAMLAVDSLLPLASIDLLRN